MPRTFGKSNLRFETFSIFFVQSTDRRWPKHPLAPPECFGITLRGGGNSNSTSHSSRWRRLPSCELLLFEMEETPILRVITVRDEETPILQVTCVNPKPGHCPPTHCNLSVASQEYTHQPDSINQRLEKRPSRKSPPVAILK